jgi:DNA polymerase elongation subunit (family B)
MYQAVYYDYFKKHIYLRDDQHSDWIVEEFNHYAYKPNVNGKYKDLFGTNYKKVGSNNYKKGDLTVLEQDVSPVLRTLVDRYLADDSLPTFNKLGYIDIETQMLSALNRDTIKLAEAKITSLAIIDDTTKIKYVLIVDTKGTIKEIDTPNKKIIPFRSETFLIKYFLQLWEECDFINVATWNGDFFDIPYLYYRISKVLSKKEANKLSPIGKVEEQEWNDNQMIKIGGINSLDYMRLYKKFIPKGLAGGFSLNNVSNYELGHGKIKYSGNLDTLFSTDIEKFIDYNLNDVELLVELESKLSFITLAQSICHICKCEYEKIYFSSILLEGVILAHLTKQGIVSPNKPTTVDPSLKKTFEDDLVDIDDDTDEEDIIVVKGKKKKTKFKGAYVMNPIIGLHGYVFDNDFSSLYPSILQSGNMSIETMIGRILDTNVSNEKSLGADYLTLDRLESYGDTVTLELLDKSLSQIDTKEFIQYMRDNEFSISANGIIFNNHKKSFISEVLDIWMDIRKLNKNLMLDCRKSGDYKKASYYDLVQSVYKILANSLYGVLALPSFRYTDPYRYLASATTANGQNIIKNTINLVNNKFNNELKLTTPYDFVIASDTDSVYVRTFKVAQHRLGVSEEIDDVMIPFTEDLSDEVSNDINIFFDKYSVTAFNMKSHKLGVKPEYIIKKAYWQKKKRYCVYLVRKERTPIKEGSEFDFKGLDILKSNFPKKFKEFSKQIYIDILMGAKKSEIDGKILDFKDYIVDCDIHEIALPITVKQMLTKYIASPPNRGQIFSKTMKGALSQFKASIFYNDLIKFYKLDNKFSQINLGEAITYCYLKDNPYKIESLAFKAREDTPEQIMQIIDKFADKNKNFSNQLLKKLQTLYDSLDWGVVNLNRTKLTYFSKFLKQ